METPELTGRIEPRENLQKKLDTTIKRFFFLEIYLTLVVPICLDLRWRVG
jgi:hypothetical protein